MIKVVVLQEEIDELKIQLDGLENRINEVHPTLTRPIEKSNVYSIQGRFMVS